jgi:hypothetical protein
VYYTHADHARALARLARDVEGTSALSVAAQSLDHLRDAARLYEALRSLLAHAEAGSTPTGDAIRDAREAARLHEEKCSRRV